MHYIQFGYVPKTKTRQQRIKKPLFPRIVYVNIPAFAKKNIYHHHTQIILCFCSYLALVAGLASEADYIFLPEDPAITNWQDKLCHKLLQVFNLIHLQFF